MGGISKVLQYLTEHLPKTFHHPFKSMEDCKMLSFLHGVLQIYLEFWNSTDPCAEYVPDFTKPSDSVQQESENIILEISSLLKHIRTCQFGREYFTIGGILDLLLGANFGPFIFFFNLSSMLQSF